MMRSSLMLCVGLTACASFQTSKMANFAEPATRATRLLPASPPAFISEAWPGASLADALVVDGDLILDLSIEHVHGYASLRTCGPLVRLDPRTGTPRWQLARDGSCATPLALVGTAVLSSSVVGAEARWSKVDLASGQVVASARGGTPAAQLVSAGVVLTVEAGAAARHLVARDAASLEQRWTAPLPVDDSAPTLELAGSTAVVACLHSLTLIDVKTGQQRGTTPVKSLAAPVPVGHAGGVLLTVLTKHGPSTIALGLDGAERWTAVGAVGAIDRDQVLLIGDDTLAAVQLSDGAPRWRTALPSRLAGSLLVAGKQVLVPHQTGVSAWDTRSGALRFTVAAAEGEAHNRRLDQLSLDADNAVVWDTPSQIAAFEAATGEPRFTFRVRSLPFVHREARLRVAEGKTATATFTSMMTTAPANANGGLLLGTAMMAAATTEYLAAAGAANWNAMQSSLQARRKAQYVIAQRQTLQAAAGRFIVRPLSWNTGRGFLVIRRSDGAWTEITTGPSDVYEDAFRETSLAVFQGALITSSEGSDPRRWMPAPESPPVQLVTRRVMGFAPAWHPAAEYPRASIVTTGSFEPDPAR